MTTHRRRASARALGLSGGELVAGKPADLVGIDVMAHVASNFKEGASDSAAELIRAMVERGWLGVRLVLLQKIQDQFKRSSAVRVLLGPTTDSREYIAA